LLTFPDTITPVPELFAKERKDLRFEHWLGFGVTVCVSADYDEAELARVQKTKYETRFSLDQMIFRVRSELTAGKRENILVHGSDLRTGKKQQIADHNLSLLVSDNWRKVHRLLGDFLFAHLLKEYFIFMKPEND